MKSITKSLQAVTLNLNLGNSGCISLDNIPIPSPFPPSMVFTINFNFGIYIVTVYVSERFNVMKRHLMSLY